MVGFGLEYACAHIIILAEISSENLLPIRADFVTERDTAALRSAVRQLSIAAALFVLRHFMRSLAKRKHATVAVAKAPLLRKMGRARILMTCTYATGLLRCEQGGTDGRPRARCPFFLTRHCIFRVKMAEGGDGDQAQQRLVGLLSLKL